MSGNSLRVLHFADAHIDIANYGRHDSETALPIRVMDFLAALDQIVETAVSEPVDLVIFAGDAYKDRNPQPTFQREWGKRMMRLSQAGIPTLLLVGNHDVSPATGRAHTLHEFTTLEVPHIHVADTIRLFGPEELGVAAQIIAVPWVSTSRFMAYEELADKAREEILTAAEDVVAERVARLIATADPNLPLILTAHASVQGAVYGSERAVMLGHELVLSGSLVNDKRLDYVALGHIHKHQALSAKGSHPPIVYPGSIERIDFGEAKEQKGFVLATIGRGQTEWQFKKLKTRRFIDIKIDSASADTFMADIMSQLPSQTMVAGAICRVQLSYARDWEPLLDENALNDYFAAALSVQIQKHRHLEKRARLGDTVAVEELTPADLLATYWRASGLDEAEIETMQALAADVLGTSQG
ncbi:MAG: exonuclease SbcCD subunit D [Chloroflexi bacterium]|nr:exonuclease SbcCD subunit D [Chloroflexota bacterium]MBP7043466.1 exonuclease SbcCD subunit D [Chloroflexota bacterium]